MNLNKLKLLLLKPFLIVSCAQVPLERELTQVGYQIQRPKDQQFKRAAQVEGRFENIVFRKSKSFWDVLKWRLTSERTPWPDFRKIETFKVEKKRSHTLSMRVINHSSILIQWKNINILTDPHYGERSSPVSFAGPKRAINPGIKFEDLPPIDIVVISHNHYDHLDLKTLRLLEKKYQPLILAGIGTKKLLHDEGMKRVIDMDWWDFIEFNDLQLHFVPAHHWSARGLFDRRKVLWGGFVFHSQKDQESLYFAGDTGLGELKFIDLISQRFGKTFKSCFLPIGAYEPRYFMKGSHINPQEALMIYDRLSCQSGLGIHFGTFQLTDEGIDVPREDLKQAKIKYPHDSRVHRFIDPIFGKEYTFEEMLQYTHP